MRHFACGVMAMTLLCGCGGDDRITIWPPLGRVVEAVDFIESRTCDIFAFVDTQDPDIRVGFERRACTAGGATYAGAVSVTDPVACASVYVHFGLGCTVHELVHALGHWHHDDDAGSVMHRTVPPDGLWELRADDVDFITRIYCQ